MYMAVGIVSIPMGLAYAFLSVSGILTEWEKSLLLGSALVLALFVWQRLEKISIIRKIPKLASARTSNERSQNICGYDPIWVASARIAVFFSEVAPLEANVVQSQLSHGTALTHSMVG
jgi:hypothetical protein